VGKSPAQREKELRREHRLTLQREVEDRRMRRRRLIILLVVLALVLPLVGSIIIEAFGADDSSVSSTADVEDLTDTTSASVAPPVEVTVPEPGATITGATPCPAEDGSSERTTSFAEPPPMCIDPEKQYRAIVHTSEGDLTYLLHAESAPQNVNNFVVLARYHFYDGVPFYRIEPRKMLLTGDATGDPVVGEGGPGYTIPDEIPEVGVIYPAGTMAMWTDAPDQNGSRFLIAGAGDEAAEIPSSYTPIGLMLDGTEALNNIQFLGDVITGNPIGEVTIESIEIIEEEAPASDDEQPGSTTTTASE
jgi:cyclophilin family peptidyl-prolyl cis-trans isomerase